MNSGAGFLGALGLAVGICSVGCRCSYAWPLLAVSSMLTNIQDVLKPVSDCSWAVASSLTLVISNPAGWVVRFIQDNTNPKPQNLSASCFATFKVITTQSLRVTLSWFPHLRKAMFFDCLTTSTSLFHPVRRCDPWVRTSVRCLVDWTILAKALNLMPTWDRGEGLRRKMAAHLEVCLVEHGSSVSTGSGKVWTEMLSASVGV